MRKLLIAILWFTAAGMMLIACKSRAERALDLAEQGLEAAKEGRSTEAEELFAKALELDPYQEKAMHGLARLHLDRGETRTVLKIIKDCEDPECSAMRREILQAIEASGIAAGNADVFLEVKKDLFYEGEIACAILDLVAKLEEARSQGKEPDPSLAGLVRKEIDKLKIQVGDDASSILSGAELAKASGALAALTVKTCKEAEKELLRVEGQVQGIRDSMGVGSAYGDSSDLRRRIFFYTLLQERYKAIMENPPNPQQDPVE